MKKAWIAAAALAAVVFGSVSAQAADRKGEMMMDPTKVTAVPTKIVQTAGRDAMSEFAPKFAELNDDVLFGEVWCGPGRTSCRSATEASSP